MSKVIVWTCGLGHGFTAFEMEMGMSYATMAAMMAQEALEHNLAADTAHEDSLARLHAIGEFECPWPWYAEQPVTEAEQELIPRVAIWDLYADTAKAYEEEGGYAEV